MGITYALAFVTPSNVGHPAVDADLHAAGGPHTARTVLMTQVLAYAAPLLPYQANPIVVAAVMAKVPMRYAVLTCVIIGAFSYLVRRRSIISSSTHSAGSDSFTGSGRSHHQCARLT